MNGALGGSAQVNGVEGVLSAYEDALQKYELSGPTNFAEVIGHVNSQVEAQAVSQESQKYHILLILTDGQISDMD